MSPATVPNSMLLVKRGVPREGVSAPVWLAGFIDRFFDSRESNYWALYKVRDTFFERGNGQSNATVAVAKLLDELDHDCLVEAALRQAGFVMGFVVCRQLRLGEIQLEDLTKNADRGDHAEGSAQ